MKKFIFGILTVGLVFGLLIGLKAEKEINIFKAEGISESVICDGYLSFWDIDVYEVAKGFAQLVNEEISVLIKGFDSTKLSWYYGREQKSNKPVVALYTTARVFNRFIYIGRYAEKLYAQNSPQWLSSEAKKMAKEFYEFYIIDK